VTFVLLPGDGLANLKDPPSAPQDIKSESQFFFLSSTCLYGLSKKEIPNHNSQGVQ